MRTLLYSTKNEELSAILAAALNDCFQEKEAFEAVERGDGFYDVFILGCVLGPIGKEKFIDHINGMKSVYLVMKGVIAIKEHLDTYEQRKDV